MDRSLQPRGDAGESRQLVCEGGDSISIPSGTTLAPGQYLTIANNLPAFAAAYPGVSALGPFSGSLSNRNERILLDDAFGNPADEVHFFDGGSWPEMADGAGASLELRDPDADNSKGESWAASNEGRGHNGTPTVTRVPPRTPCQA